MSRAERKLKKLQAKEELKRIKQEKRQQRLEKQKQNQEAWSNADPGTKIVMIAVSVIVVFGIFIVAINGSKDVASTKPKEPPKPKATFTGEVVSFTPIDPTSLRVVVKVKNTSTVEGKPSCLVDAYNPSRAYSGWDSFQLDRAIAPGQEDTFNGNLTITKEGAYFVTKATANCT